MKAWNSLETKGTSRSSQDPDQNLNAEDTDALMAKNKRKNFWDKKKDDAEAGGVNK